MHAASRAWAECTTGRAAAAINRFTCRLVEHGRARCISGDPTPPVVAFPTPAYDPALDRFELTAKGEAYLNGAAGQPLA